MNAELLEEKLAEYVDGVLPPDERAAVEAALRDDPALAVQVAQLRRLRRLIRALPDDEPPPAMLHAVWSATTRKRLGWRDRLPRLSFLFGPLPIAAAALVVVAALGAGFYAYMQTSKYAAPPTAISAAKDHQPSEPPPALRPEVAAAPPPVEQRLREMEKMMRQLTPPAGDLAGAGGLRRTVSRTDNRIEPPVRPPLAMQPAFTAGGEGTAVGDEAAMDKKVAKPAPSNAPAAAPAREKSAVRKGESATAGAVDALTADRSRAPAAESAAAPPGSPPHAAAIFQRWDNAHCGLARPTVAAATDAASWRRLWLLMHANVVDKPPEPDIDFDHQAAITAFMGEKPTGGFATQIVEVRREGDAVAVVVHETSPQPGRLMTESLTQPCSTVLIPREVDGLRIRDDTPLTMVKR